MDMNILYHACPSDAVLQSLTVKLANGRTCILTWMDHILTDFGNGDIHINCIDVRSGDDKRHISIEALKDAVITGASWYSETAFEPGNENVDQWMHIEIKRLIGNGRRVIYKGRPARIELPGSHNTEPDDSGRNEVET